MSDNKTIISAEDVDYVAKLAHLQFTSQEAADCTAKLASILNYMQELQKIDVTDVPITTHVLPLQNVFREDETGSCLSREAALANAPEQWEGYFKVPRII